MLIVFYSFSGEQNELGVTSIHYRHMTWKGDGLKCFASGAHKIPALT